MAQIGNVPEIKAVKKQLEALKGKGLVERWELPYEQILTRLTAAIFFVEPGKDVDPDLVWQELAGHAMFQCRPNEEKKLSPLPWRVEFNKGFEL